MCHHLGSVCPKNKKQKILSSKIANGFSPILFSVIILPNGHHVLGVFELILADMVLLERLNVTVYFQLRLYYLDRHRLIEVLWLIVAMGIGRLDIDQQDRPHDNKPNVTKFGQT